MNKLVSLLALLAVTAAKQVPDVDPLDNALDFGYDSRMVGGEIVTDANTFPFVIAIQPRYLDNGVQTRAPVCSGVLIKGTGLNAAGTAFEDKYWVLTSAHCALSGTSLDLFAGKIKVTTQAADETVASSLAIINDEYRQSMLTGDLALIPTAITESAAPNLVTAATLANIDDVAKSYLKNTVTMAGWGYPNDVYSEASPSLRSLRSWVVPNWYCAVRNLGLPIKRTHVCTAGLTNKGPCTGDSGAPLVATVSTTSGSSTTTSTRVIGLATLTPADGCSRGRPGIFTRLGNYLSWIRRVTNYDDTSS